MEPSKEAIAVRITRLNRQILGKVYHGSNKQNRNVDREALLDALTVLYDECNEDPVKKCDDLVKAFVDKYRSTMAELRRTRVSLTDFEMLQTIGRGHFGDVHMVREKQTGDVYALKSVRKELAGGERGAGGSEREVLATACSHWMPRLQYAFQDSSTVYLVMELCVGGDLAGLLSRRRQPLAERDAAFYVVEVAHALKALHGMGYVHRDLKPHNILLDRCGHVKLGDFGSATPLALGAEATPRAGTADYVAPELLAAAHCKATHSTCHQACQGITATAISACDYWSLGVVAFELVTLRRPFSDDDDDSVPKILSNIQKYERDPQALPPFAPPPAAPGDAWRALVAGLLRVNPAKRYNYLDTLQHPALKHLPSHTIRDQPPPWVPPVRGPEDASHFAPPPRRAPPPSPAPFRARPPFAGQLPYLGYTYVAPDHHDDSSVGFNASHDSTAIDMTTFKSAEKLAAMRGREIAALQSRLAVAEAAAAATAAAERGRRHADDEAETVRARLQAEITALTLQNKRLERQIDIEKEERMAVERTNQQLKINMSERNTAEIRAAQAMTSELQSEKDTLKAEMRKLEARLLEVQAECQRATAAAESARAQQKHYKDTIAKERALRRQTLSGGEVDGREASSRVSQAEAESREAGVRAAQAEAGAARDARARKEAEARLAAAEADNAKLVAELDETRRELDRTKNSLGENKRVADSSSEQVHELQVQLAQEKVRVSALTSQVQELERGLNEASRREAALEEQYVRTEARLMERQEAAEARAATALHDEARHREKVNKLEQLVRQLEREVGALESRACAVCERGETEGAKDAASDTESVVREAGDGAAVHQVALLREQLQRAETALQTRAEEMAALRQEARTANLARWRKEREFNELEVEAKSAKRDIKRLEDRLSTALESRKAAEQKAAALQSEIAELRPQWERASKELERVKEQLAKLEKFYETAQAEVDRSRNDIRKLKCELQYSEKRRRHAEEQEELSSRERGQLRDECTDLRARNTHLEQNNKALQEACTLLEDQLTDLERLTDLSEGKTKDLEAETSRMRQELEQCRSRLVEAEQQALARGADAEAEAGRGEAARHQASLAQCQLTLLQDRLSMREDQVSSLESRLAAVESDRAAAEAALNAAGRRVLSLQEECAALRTQAHTHHERALVLQASLADAQEEISALRETQEAATAWWRTRETKAEGTLRQQAKLIDFLQAKLEEASRKKCSLGHRLFGRTNRRTGNATSSPPLRRVNKDLRNEVDRLRSKLAGSTVNGAPYPYAERTGSKHGPATNSPKKIDTRDTPDGDQENSMQVVWSDGSRSRATARRSGAGLLLRADDREYHARLISAGAANLPNNEATRAFTVKLDKPSPTKGSEAVVVCDSAASRATWVTNLSGPQGWSPTRLAELPDQPSAALQIAPNAVAIGSSAGLVSLRGIIAIEVECDVSPPRHASQAVTALTACGGRALLVAGPALAHVGLLALGSALRRAATLQPRLSLDRVSLPDTTTPHLIRAISDDTQDGPCAAVACGRRIFLLRFAASTTEFKIVRSITVDRPTPSILLTAKAMYIAGEKPLRINLPSGALETFGMDEPIIAAAAKKHTPPRAILLINKTPLELLICYSECGVFVDENGRRTRNEDPKWSSAIHGWEYVKPFLYVVGEEKVTIIYITDEVYRAPPCTCDTHSLASTSSECYAPETFNMKVTEPKLLGTALNGIIISSKTNEAHSVSIVEGLAAFRSIGASVESLDTVPDSQRSSSSLDRSPSMNDLPQDISQESVTAEPNTFLADIRCRVKQLGKKTREEQTQEDVIKKILTTEVGLKRQSTGRKSPAMTSEFDSDSESESDPEQNGTESKGTSEICAEMFTRQVRFQ